MLAGKRVLFAGDDAVERARYHTGSTAIWVRESGQDADALPWPPAGPYDAAVLRIARSREAYVMALHALAANLPEGAPLFVQGPNDEGIKSAPRAFAPFFIDATTIAARAHGRVWRALRSGVSEGLRATLPDWRTVRPLEIAGRTQDWVAYPGVFAHGGLDAGTALLLAHLPAGTRGLRALDFGAGSGILARALVDRGASVTMVERDAVAQQAARENVPEARALLAPDLQSLGRVRFDLVVSNPPLHEGRARSLAILERLIADAPLAPGGALLFVTERTVPVPRLAAQRFKSVVLAAEQGGYRVWRLEEGRSIREREP